jgi:prepilin-type processing-associated H-X9-DG protein
MAKSRSKAWGQVLVFFIVLFFLIGLLTPEIQRARDGSLKTYCENNLRQIALALLDYESDHGHFPPPYVADADGKPMHSWRTLILPYLDRTDIYNAYNFKEPWNGPSNGKLTASIVHFFQCPGDRNNKLSNRTNYVAVIGPNTAWPGDKSSNVERISEGDGTSNTILLVELPDSDIQWAEPRDLSFDELCHKMTPEQRAKIFDAHGHRAVVVYADGHCEFLTASFLEKNIEALLTVNGGEKIDFSDPPSFLSEEIAFILKNIASLLVLIAALLVIIYRPLPKENTNEEEEIRREDTSNPQTNG